MKRAHNIAAVIFNGDPLVWLILEMLPVSFENGRSWIQFDSA